MDYNEQHPPRKNKPSLEPGFEPSLELSHDPVNAFSTAPAPVAAPAAQQPALAAGEMPSWLAKPPASPTAAQRWGRRLMFAGAAVVTVALAGGATLLGLDMYESRASGEIAENPQDNIATPASTPALAPPSSTLPLVERRPSNVPPLVLLPQDPNAKKAAAAPIAPDAATAAVSVPVSVPVSAPGAPVMAQNEGEEAGAAPVPVPMSVPAGATKTPPVAAPKKTPAASVAAPPAQSAAAQSPAVSQLPPTTAVKKPVAAVKRPAKPVLAKAKPVKPAKPAKPVKGTMLQPPRDQFDDRADEVVREELPAPRRAIDRRCRPGELARECEARIR